MNDLDLLTLIDRDGPQALPLRDDVYARTAAALAAEVRSTVGAAPARGRRLAGWLTPARVSAGAAVAAVAAIAAGLLAPFGGQPALSLERRDPLTFPVSATALPRGLHLTRYTFDRQSQTAMYGPDPSCADAATCGAQRVTVVTGRPLASWHIPEGADAVDVDGRPGLAFASSAARRPEVSVVWTMPNGLVVGVTGEGRYANRSSVAEIAASVKDRPRPVDLFLTLAPRGWRLNTYLSDQFIAYGDDGQLSVSLNRPNTVDLTPNEADDIHTVEVDGRTAQIGVTESGGWILETAARDGRAFTLQAPRTLDEHQVEQIAAGVRHS